MDRLGKRDDQRDMTTCSSLTKVPPGNQEKHVESREEERLRTTPVSIPLAPILAGQGAALPDTKAEWCGSGTLAPVQVSGRLHRCEPDRLQLHL